MTYTPSREIESPVQMVDFELLTYIPNELCCAVQRPFKIMKHIQFTLRLEPFYLNIKSGILRTSVYNVYGSQNEFADSRAVVKRLTDR